MTADVQRELAEVTDAHRAEAHRIWNEALCNAGIPGWDRDAELAQAIADAEKRAAARELEQAIAEIGRDRDNCPNKVRRQGYGGALYVLKARAAALDPSGAVDGAQT